MKAKYKTLLIDRLNKGYMDGFITEISSAADSWDILWSRSEKLDRKRIIWSDSSVIKVSEENTIIKYSKD